MIMVVVVMESNGDVTGVNGDDSDDGDGGDGGGVLHCYVVLLLTSRWKI